MIAPSRDLDAEMRVSFDRARALIVSACESLGSEDVSLVEAGGRVVAANLRADADIVPYARSGMDGYALRARDTVGADVARVMLPIDGFSYAGHVPPSLRPGTVMAIATGAALPEGADAVVPIERVEVRGGDIVLSMSLQPGDHVFQPGDDATSGEILARAGDVLTAGRIGLLAAAGHARVPVVRRPRVAIVCTGDEVVPVTATPRRGEIRNSNAAMLAVALAQDGADVVSVSTVADAPIPLAAALREALACSDLVITTGGASVGERDYVKNAFVALGATFAFRSIALRPSKPTAFGRRGATRIAVLPGNPAAAFVAYAALVRGAVRKLAGRSDAFPRPVRAMLEGTIRAKPERHYVMFACLSNDGRSYAVSPLENQCSSLVRTAADANALIIVPPGAGELAPGSFVDVERLP